MDTNGHGWGKMEGRVADGMANRWGLFRPAESTHEACVFRQARSARHTLPCVLTLLDLIRAIPATAGKCVFRS